MIDFDSTRNVMSKPFDINVHKQTFTHYLEIVLDPDGNIFYAVPSHNEWIISYLCGKDNQTYDELMSTIPREYWLNM